PRAPQQHPTCPTPTHPHLCLHLLYPLRSLLFFFTAPAPTELYTLSLHDALPIYAQGRAAAAQRAGEDDDPAPSHFVPGRRSRRPDRKSTRLNSSHRTISYAVFCLKKKKKRRHGTHSASRQGAPDTARGRAATARP